MKEKNVSLFLLPPPSLDLFETVAAPFIDGFLSFSSSVYLVVVLFFSSILVRSFLQLG